MSPKVDQEYMKVKSVKNVIKWFNYVVHSPSKLYNWPYTDIDFKHTMNNCKKLQQLKQISYDEIDKNKREDIE